MRAPRSVVKASNWGRITSLINPSSSSAFRLFWTPSRTRASKDILSTSGLMQKPLGAAFARKVLRCKARDEGRMLALFDEARNAAAGHFSCKPFGAVLGGARRSGRAKATAQRRRAIDRAPRPCFAPSTARAITCFVASLANSPAIRLRLASRISPRQAAPRPHGVLHQPASPASLSSKCRGCSAAPGDKH